MKKFYFSLVCALILSAFGFTANAEDVQITLKWDNPGALAVRVGTTDVEIAEDATECTIVRDKSTWPSAVIKAANGYQLVSCTYVDVDGNEQSVRLNTVSQQFSISMSSSLYNGRTFTITTKKLELNDDLTINVENGASKLKEIMLSTTGTVLTVNDGENKFKFDSGVDKQLTITPRSGQEVYKVTADGNEVTRTQTWNPYTVDLNPGTVINVRVYENDSDVPQVVTVTFSATTPIECVTQIYNFTQASFVEVANGSFQAETGDQLKISFSEDWDINEVKYLGEPVTVGTDYSGMPVINNFIVTGAGEFDVDATQKQYQNVQFTAYIVDAAGIELYAGTRVNGTKIELGEGELVTDAVELPAFTEDGIEYPAYTVPAGTMRKYTFDVSSKYGSVNYYLDYDYWMRAARNGALNATVDNPISDNVFYLINEKIENDSKAFFYFDFEPEGFLYTGTYRYIQIAQGYNAVEFDADYDNGFQLGFYDLGSDKLTFVLNGEVINLSPDSDSGNYYPTIHDGDVFKVYRGKTTATASTVTFKKHVAAEVTYDKNFTLAADSTTLAAFNGTEIVVKPATEAPVKVNGVALTADADGAYTFTTSGEHIVKIGDADIKYEFSPAAQTETPLDSLNYIIISFPEATKVERNGSMGDDEILFRLGWSWVAQVSVAPVADAAVPSFKISFAEAPVTMGTYSLMIPEGFFVVDYEALPEVSARFNFAGAKIDLTPEYNPTGDIVAADWLYVAIVFPEGARVQLSDMLLSSMMLEFTPAGAMMPIELAYPNDFEVSAESNFLMFNVVGESVLNQPGQLSLYVAHGAFTVNGQESPELSHTWNVVEPRTYEFTFNPDGLTSIESLAEITITINGADEAIINNPNGVTMRNGYGADAYFATATLTAVEGAEVPTFKATFDPAPTVSGTYTLSIGGYTFGMDNLTSNDPITKVYDFVSGVESVIADDYENADIYNLQGIKLNAAWSELPAGFYIVGGKVVKK